MRVLVALLWLLLPAAASAQTAQDIADFTSLISWATADQQAAIGRARTAYNTANPLASIGSDAAYWYFVFNSANQSYIIHYPAQ